MRVEEPQVRELARLLELRGQADDQAAVRHAYLDALQVGPGEQVLDVGCGTGVVTRAVARQVGPSGRVVGLDPTPLMLSVAREIAEQEGVHEQIEFRVGDVLDLPFDDATFDVLVAITVLSHTIPGLLRVLRPGGRIGILDLDSTSWVIWGDLRGGVASLARGTPRRASGEALLRRAHPPVHLGAPPCLLHVG